MRTKSTAPAATRGRSRKPGRPIAPDRALRALATAVFALAGVIIGLSVILRSHVSRPCGPRLSRRHPGRAGDHGRAACDARSSTGYSNAALDPVLVGILTTPQCL